MQEADGTQWYQGPVFESANASSFGGSHSEVFDCAVSYMVGSPCPHLAVGGEAWVSLVARQIGERDDAHRRHCSLGVTMENAKPERTSNHRNERDASQGNYPPVAVAREVGGGHESGPAFGSHPTAEAQPSQHAAGV